MLLFFVLFETSKKWYLIDWLWLIVIDLKGKLSFSYIRKEEEGGGETRRTEEWDGEGDEDYSSSCSLLLLVDIYRVRERMSSSLQKVKEACVQLKAAVTSSNPDTSKATEVLEELKVMLYCYSFRHSFRVSFLITSLHFTSLHFTTYIRIDRGYY